MKKHSLFFCAGLLFTAARIAQAAEPAGPKFETDVRPILKAHCWQCHGEVEELKGELDTRLARLVLQGGESGPAIVPGRHAESLLYERVSSGEMPPGPKTLSKQEIAILARWIDAGAGTLRPEPEILAREGNFTEEDQQHWSFQPIQRAELPTVENTRQLRSPIDAFLLARLEELGLGYSQPASRETLIRRLSLDLHGLPPPPAAVEMFVADQEPGAYDRLVDRLLSSPAYGERWARHWLDVAGYADSDGVTKQDSVRAWAYKYRDYVIRAFNTDKPWDSFLIEQLAGDELLTAPYENLSRQQADKLIATGFLRMSPDGSSGSTLDQDATRNQTVAEVIKVVSTSLLGLSVGCAQCHPHRYDPITQTDYYRLRALLEPSYDWKNWRNPDARLVSQWSQQTRQRAEEVDRQLKELADKRDAELDAAVSKVVGERIAKLPEEIRQPARLARETPQGDRNEEQNQLVEDHPFLKVTRNSLQEIESQLKNEILSRWDPLIEETGKKRPLRDYLMCLTEVPGKVPLTHLFARGDFKQPGGDVAPGELSILDSAGLMIPLNNPELPTSGRRLAYARHLTSGRHPLLARVLVNRFWMHHFGIGLVSTPGEFGVQGERPSHPDLLDWLAAEFMESGWSLKQLQRLIVTSTAYRQIAARNEKAEAIDPDNRLLGRMSVRRLEAETVRDSLLAISGQLLNKMYGPPAPVSLDAVGQRVIVSVNQYDPSGRLLRDVAAVGDDQFRRTIYIQVRRSMPLGVLVPFDLPTLKPNCQLRTFSTNAPQSLLMMNDPFVLQQVESLAELIFSQVGADPARQLQRAWQIVLGRQPTDAQQQAGQKFLEEQAAAIRKASPQLANPQQAALSHLCQALVSSNGFLYVE